jgi:hypothetical protein
MFALVGVLLIQFVSEELTLQFVKSILKSLAQQISINFLNTCFSINAEGMLILTSETRDEHTDFSFHTDLVCNYDKNATSHSALIGVALDGRGIYGVKESSYSLPTDLDACGGHYGNVPAYTIGGVTYASASNVYHYHTQNQAPFFLGCYGPVSTLAACRALYPKDCGSGTTTLSGIKSDGSTCSYSYDTDCPCYKETGLVYSNNQMCGETTTIAAAVTYNLIVSSNTVSTAAASPSTKNTARGVKPSFELFSALITIFLLSFQ